VPPKEVSRPAPAARSIHPRVLNQRSAASRISSSACRAGKMRSEFTPLRWWSSAQNRPRSDLPRRLLNHQRCRGHAYLDLLPPTARRIDHGPGLSRGGCRCCRIGRFWSGPRCQFRPDKPECADGGFYARRRVGSGLRDHHTGVCPQPAQVVHSSVERLSSGPEIMSHVAPRHGLTLLSGAGL
jgi:hypothetical protein